MRRRGYDAFRFSRGCKLRGDFPVLTIVSVSSAIISTTKAPPCSAVGGIIKPHYPSQTQRVDLCSQRRISQPFPRYAECHPHPACVCVCVRSHLRSVFEWVCACVFMHMSLSLSKHSSLWVCARVCVCACVRWKVLLPAVADYPLQAGSVNFRAKKSTLIGGKGRSGAEERWYNGTQMVSHSRLLCTMPAL